MVHAVQYTGAKFTFAHSSHNFTLLLFRLALYDDDKSTLVPVFGILFASYIVAHHCGRGRRRPLFAGTISRKSIYHRNIHRAQQCICLASLPKVSCMQQDGQSLHTTEPSLSAC
jgi:hypothetical protein